MARPATSLSDALFGHRALRLLMHLKLRAALRQQLRRLRRPSGWVFALLGLALMLAWLSSFFLPPAQTFSGEHVVLATQFSLLVIVVMTVISAFNHRGLYLPREEIELCFSAPLERSDLVRYRLLVNLLRSLFAGIVFGYMTARRMPVAFYAFSGVVLTMSTVPIVGQAAALLLGDVENRWARAVQKLPVRVISGVMGGLVGLGILVLFFGSDLGELGPFGGSASLMERARELAATPLAAALLLPFKPWALMITARDAAGFLAWGGFCIAFWCIAFELCARIPIDFRELSLTTSADVARRLNRLRRGGFGASGAAVDKQALGWRVPWVFGRGAFGAIAWLKLAAIVRKARGTLIVSTLLVAFLTLVATVAFPDPSPEHVLGGAAVLAGAGTLYLCSGLRFDFRQDLEQMELIKSWPVSPSRVFLAMLVPEVLLVSAVLVLGILARALVTGQFHAALLWIVALQPVVTLAWLALDNAVYLFAPLRYTPGQEGALQHMGRSLVLMMLRSALFLAAAIAAGVPAFLVYLLLARTLGAHELVALSAAGALAWVILAAVDALLVWSGGKMLSRFDVARDRG